VSPEILAVIQSLQSEVDSSPWLQFKLLADALLDAGEDQTASGYRWIIQRRLRPQDGRCVRGRPKWHYWHCPRLGHGPYGDIIARLPAMCNGIFLSQRIGNPHPFSAETPYAFGFHSLSGAYHGAAIVVGIWLAMQEMSSGEANSFREYLDTEFTE
jgi:hypothetical protein